MKDGRIVLLLDALDEMLVNLPLAERDVRLERLNDFLKGLGACPVVLASRVREYPVLTALKTEYTLLELDDDQVAALVRHRVKERARADALLRRLKERGLHDFGRTPLTLGIIADLFLAGRLRLEQLNRATLFREYAEFLLERERDDKGTPLDVRAVMDALADLALARREGREDPHLPGFVEYEHARCASLLKQYETRLEFWHEQLREYFAARALLERWRRGESLEPLLADAAQAETVALMAEELQGKEADRFFDLLLSRKRGSLANKALGCGEVVLVSSLGSITEEYRARVAEVILDTMRGMPGKPQMRAFAGKIVGRSGDPRFRADAWFLPDDEMLGFIHIPAGPFQMGTPEEAIPALMKQYSGGRKRYEAEVPRHVVNLPEFYIARWPVTLAQFRVFVDDKNYEAQGSWRHLSGADNEPVVAVTWHDAIAYCHWLGGCLKGSSLEPLAELLRGGQWRLTLPSEAEWEKAARGDRGGEFPWGDEADPDCANFDKTGIGTTSAVGCFPDGASSFGVEELNGNVWEWTRSLWGADWYKPLPYPYQPGKEREDLAAGDKVLRVLRGGSFDSEADYARCAARSGARPAQLRREPRVSCCGVARRPLISDFSGL